MGPTLIAPLHTPLCVAAVTSVWNPEVGSVICQYLGEIAAEGAQTSVHHTRK